MAISRMSKVMVTVWRGQAPDLLEAIQQAGVMQVLNAETATITKEWPELEVQPERAREVEDIVTRLDKAIAFLQRYQAEKKGVLAALAPRAVIDAATYKLTAAGTEALEMLQQTERVAAAIEKYHSEIESLRAKLKMLIPWKALETPVEDLRSLDRVVCQPVLVPQRKFEDARNAVTSLGAGLQVIGSSDGMAACIIITLAENSAEVQKALRSLDAEMVAFEDFRGTIANLIDQAAEGITRLQYSLDEALGKARTLAKDALKLGIMHDHCRNLLSREIANRNAPATDNAVFFEGWVRDRDYKRLERVVAGFEAASVQKMALAEQEEHPIEIENGQFARPFETITRLYGLPATTDVDPTAFLAPFFALFFGLCLTDAGYGLVLIALLAWVVKKMQGDKKAIWMLLICSVVTVAAGVITGGWFADAIQRLLPQNEGSIGATLNAWRTHPNVMLFDPMDQPLIFIGISLALGYIQVLFGLGIAFVNHLRQKNYAAAIFEKLTWLILLNCILLYALAKYSIIPAGLAPVTGTIAIVQLVMIFWFTERNSGLAGRIGGGTFAVFSTVFYIGDMLSYVRLMALGMVTAGLGMAINILTQLVMDLPYVGFIAGLLLFVAGHSVNMALSLLGAFVHSLRLQFVEFFPKFFVGGGRQFQPLRNDYPHVMIAENDSSAGG